MVTDIRNRSHRPKGLPARVAGTYEPTGGASDDSDLDATPIPAGNNAMRRRAYERNAETRRGWEYAERLLAATLPGDGYDYRNEPVLTPEGELDLVRRAIIDDTDPDRPRWGPVMRAFAPFFPNRVECEEMARTWTDDALLALRRSCAIDPTKAYTPALAAHKLLHEPVRVERILAREPFNLSAHRMRVGIRYGRRIDEYRAAHGGRLPDGRERDRLWDEAMSGFIREKTETGASYGRGMYYSDGRSADPRTNAYRTGRIRRYKPTGKPFNARKDYEGMLRRGREALSAVTDVTLADAMNLTDTEREQVGLEAVYRQALDRGLDTRVLRDRLGIDPATAAAWEEEYRRDA